MTAWSTLLDREDVLILDTETTGLKPHHEVVEVAVINTRGGSPFQRADPAYRRS